MYSMIISLLFLYFVFISFKWYSKRIKILKTFVKSGIRGPKPSFISGNLYHLRQYSDPNIKFDEWFEKYGNIFGYFLGDIPILVINDLELIEQIFITKNNNFSDRPPNFIEAKPFVDSLVYLRGHRWKCVRKVMTPTLSANKIISSDHLIDSMTSCIERFIEFVDKEDSKIVNVEHRMQLITLDIICKTVLNLNEELDPNVSEELLSALNEYLNHAMNPIVDLALFFPFLRTIFRLINNYLTAGRMTDMIVRHLKRKIEEFEDKSCVENSSNLLLTLMKSYFEQKLSKEELIANIHIILIAGFETTSTALTFTLYLLARHESVQNQLRQHLLLDGYKSQFLEMVWNESLRLYPPVFGFVTRIAAQNTKIKDLVIEKGTVVQVPVWRIQHDSHLWTNPLDFNPLRFSQQNKTSINWSAFQAFGSGNRSCIGRHFAKIEALLTLSMIVRKFKVECCEQTTDTLEFRCPTGVVLKPKVPLFLRFIPIHQK